MANPDVLLAPLKLKCGKTIPNRIAKAAMTEGVADDLSRATVAHKTLYTKWSDGCGLLITGNIMVDRRYMERPGNVAIAGPQDEMQRLRLRAFARAATQHGNHCWAQLSHAGRQSHKTIASGGLGPSAVAFEAPGKDLGMKVDAPREITKEVRQAETMSATPSVIAAFAIQFGMVLPNSNRPSGLDIVVIIQ